MLVWNHAPLLNTPAGPVSIHGHQHTALKPADSPHITPSVVQVVYRPVSMVRIWRLAGDLVAGERPAGTTTLDRIEDTESKYQRGRASVRLTETTSNSGQPQCSCKVAVSLGFAPRQWLDFSRQSVEIHSLMSDNFHKSQVRNPRRDFNEVRVIVDQ